MCCPAHEENSGIALSRLGTIIQSIFCAQLGVSIRLTLWKWSGESWYPGALLPMMGINVVQVSSPEEPHNIYNMFLKFHCLSV